MVSLAIWLISAVVVVFFVLMVINLVALMWRWIILGIAMLALIILLQIYPEITGKIIWTLIFIIAAPAFIPQKTFDRWVEQILRKLK